MRSPAPLLALLLPFLLGACANLSPSERALLRDAKSAETRGELESRIGPYRRFNLPRVSSMPPVISQRQLYMTARGDLRVDYWDAEAVNARESIHNHEPDQLLGAIIRQGLKLGLGADDPEDRVWNVEVIPRAAE
jgi:hypothetical protein